MKKGVLEMCLLYRIAQGETYGYDLLGQMAQAFPEVHESTVYAILRRLAAEGYAETYTGAISGGPARKYYRITAGGQARLGEQLRDWERLHQAVRSLGLPAPAATASPGHTP